MRTMRLVKIFVLILSLLVLWSLFVSCTDDKKGNDTDSGGSSAEAPANVLTLIEGGKSKCTVVYPARGSKKEAAVAFAISAKLGELYGVEVKVADDYGTEEALSTDDVEILIGNVKRTETGDVCAMLEAPTDIAVKVVNNKLVIAANNDSGYDRALAYFEEQYLAQGGDSLYVPRDTSYIKLLSENLFLQNIASYTVVYPYGANVRLKQAAEQLNASLGEYLGGKSLTVTSDSAKEVPYEILIGETNRDESASDSDLDYYRYSIRSDNNKIVIQLGGSFAAGPAAEKLVELIICEELGDTYTGGVDMSLFDPLAHEQSTFVPAWQGSITVPDWMTDFNEKLYAITNPSGRPMAVAHRGDVIHYPENSLEGILSAAMLGADVIELDIVMTKDNVAVLCHDTDLSRTTNVRQMKGRNGLPDSTEVGDWTYEELRRLSLLDDNGDVTSYKIPSYYEILLTLRGRCFILLDAKAASGITAEDILEIETSADALETSIYSMFVSATSGPAQANSYKYMTAYSEAHPELTRFAGFIKSVNSYMNMSGHSIRQRGWLEGRATTDPNMESHDRYLSAYTTKGLKLIYTNNIPLMSTFIAKYQPDLK